MNECCTTGFAWNGTPTGREGTLGDQKTYIAGDNAKRAILVVHDAFGWEFNNTRLLADHYAKEVGATVYLPDFYHGFAVGENDVKIKIEGGKATMEANLEFDIAKWFATNAPEIRIPEVLACARRLREQYAFVGGVGFCWGGSVGFMLASKEQAGLLDCITIAHPGTPSDDDILNLSIPVQIISPEFDPTFTQDRKDFCNNEIPKLGIDYMYNYFPKVAHGFCTKSDPKQEVEKRALERAKTAVVNWFLTYAERKS